MHGSPRGGGCYQLAFRLFIILSVDSVFQFGFSRHPIFNRFLSIVLPSYRWGIVNRDDDQKIENLRSKRFTSTAWVSRLAVGRNLNKAPEKKLRR